MESGDVGGEGRGTRASRVSARRRVAVAFAAGAVTFGVAILLTPWEIASLMGWNVTAVVFNAWVWLSIGRLDSAETAELATAEDDSRVAADIVLMAACGASLVGVALALLEAAGAQGVGKVVMTAVASLSVVLSWATVNTVFTLRYAHLYHAGRAGGIEFGDGSGLDYRDFAYVAFTIGMTYQVSDTALTSKRMRSTALRHAFLSYVFGVAVVAMVINIVTGLFNT